jgi:hemoglobin
MAKQEPVSLYERVGGEAGVRRLVEIFYDLVEQHPEGRELNLLHLRGHGVAHSRIEQFNFLSGFLGGPRLYTEKHGHSNVREMHAHVVIDTRAHDAWLRCMSMALEQAGIDEDAGKEMMAHFRAVAALLKNAD